MNDDLHAELLRIYATEAAGLVDRTEEALEEVLRAPASSGARGELRRLLHALKGGAYTAELRALGDLVHALEDAFAGEQPSPAVLRAAHRAMEGVGEVVQALGRGEPFEEGRVVGLRDAFLLGSEGDEAEAAPQAEDRGQLQVVRESIGRVDLAVLERLATRLLEAQGLTERLEEALEQVGSGDEVEEARGVLRATREALSAAQQDSTRLRLRPVGDMLAGLRRTFQDATQQVGRAGALELQGQDVQIDRRMAEEVRPLLEHLVRNAVVHGGEELEARRAAGKPEALGVWVRCQAQGIRVEFEVRDDGRGFDAARLVEVAQSRGLVDAEAELGREAALQLAFQPGLSTRAEVDAQAGRGVGLDAVREAVERFNGRIELSSEPGVGSRVRLEVPTSLATARMLIVRRGALCMAVPVLAAERLLGLGEVAQRRVGGAWTVQVGERWVPVLDLGVAFRAAVEGPPAFAVVVGVGDRLRALLVDAVDAEVEAPIRPVGPPLEGVRGVAGLATLEGGRIVPVVDLRGVLRETFGGEVEGASEVVAGGGEEEESRGTVLVVDDSVTTRTLETNLLRQAGYRVLVGTDGEEGWALLRGHDVDVLITDYEMPRLDGLGLIRRVRDDAELRGCPVIMVTSRVDVEEEALAAGADHVVLKRAFDHEQLLDRVAELVERGR